MLTIKVISTPNYPNDLRVNANGVNYHIGNTVPGTGNNVPAANGSNFYAANNVYVANGVNYEEVFEAESVAKNSNTVVISKPDGTKYEIRSGYVYVMNDYGQTVSKYVL